MKVSKGRPNSAAELRKAIALAEQRGTTQYAIAKTAGMPRSQISRVASGESIPTLATADRIARAIGYEIIIRKTVAQTVRRVVKGRSSRRG